MAVAREGCGGGFYRNGHACAPMGSGYGYYRGSDYNGYVPGARVGGPNCYNYYGRRICCPPHFTVQDGVCVSRIAAINFRPSALTGLNLPSQDIR